MWGGVFSSMDCLLIHYRQKDDPYNAIAAGFITGGVLAIRGNNSINQEFRWSKCGIQKCSCWRSYSLYNRNCGKCDNSNIYKEIVSNDGRDAERGNEEIVRLNEEGRVKSLGS